MLANICTDLAGATATCNCVSVSGSEPSNLVSSDAALRSHGFRAERYVKGPVIVEIDLSRLSTQFTIEAIVMRGTVRDGSSYTGDFFVGDGDQEKFIGRLTFCGPTHPNSNPINALVRMVGKPITDLILKVKGSYVSEALAVNKFSNSVDMHNSIFMRRLDLKTLSVKITNLQGGISGGINWLEIWSECHEAPCAIPSSLPSLYTGEVLADLYACPGDKSVPSSNCQHSQEDINTQSVVPQVTPNDFLDQLTFELMEEPVTLPSGSTVDMKTINKILDQEKIPLDPFTGLSLENYVPVINVSLRDKIKDFESNKVETNLNSYNKSNSLNSKESENISDNQEMDKDQLRKKRIAYFQNGTERNKKAKVESRTRKEVLFTTRLPFEDKLPIKTRGENEIIDLTLDEDSP